MRSLMITLLLAVCSFAQAQEIVRKQMTAARVEQPPVIDGALDEALWQSAVPATDFIQRERVPGAPASQRTEVRIVYDDVAIYIGAIMHDVSADSVLHELGKRDTEGNTDLFGLVLDTYNDDINAYGFFVTAGGVQIDARYSADGQDFNWNAVWVSETRITENGWIAELKIPHSAIRFGKQQEQVWGINFLRKIRRLRENDFWNKVDPKVDGFILQSGDLTGLRDLKPPVRLSVTPYISGYIENYPYNQEGKSNNSYSLRGGMDLKYGISDGFTLDLTLVPDFGQVQSDNQVLNLSPFEVKYDERRPFFTEGTELFNKGGLLYTRRVGGMPIGYFDVYDKMREGEELIQNPEETQLINALKVSGRTQKKLGIGVFNATTAETYAIVRDTLMGSERSLLTQPLTNYSVIVFDQALRNNSYIDFINTNVMRDGAAYDANVTSAGFRLMDKKNKYYVSARGIMSQKFFSGDSLVLGHAYGADWGKSSGNFKFWMGGFVESDTYDPNDLGLLFANNSITANIGAAYNIYEPFWKVNNLFTEVNVTYERRYRPDAFSNFGIYVGGNTTFTKKFITTGLWTNLEPIITYDYFEPRVQGRFYTYPINYTYAGWISTDYRKKFAIDFDFRYRTFDDADRVTLAFGVAPRYRVSNKLSFVYDINRDVNLDDVGFADIVNDSIIFGRRNVQTITNILSANYIFTNRMALTLRVRHYWSRAKYTSYHFLEEDGMLTRTEYAGNRDVNFNAFNIDMAYTWQFAPGSEMSIVWKNAILTLDAENVVRYFHNVQNTMESPQTNSLSVKVLYYLDYLYLKRKN